jgi:nucleoside-diphosphate-sugar epimerase
VFNAGTGKRIALNGVVKLLERVTGQRIEVKYQPARSGDILHSQADISLARSVLGYEPRVDFEEGLRRTWDWYRGAFERK